VPGETEWGEVPLSSRVGAAENNVTPLIVMFVVTKVMSADALLISPRNFDE